MGFWNGVAMTLGGMDLARVIPYRFGQGQPPSAHGLVPTPPANGGHQISDGVGRATRGMPFTDGGLVDDVHQAWMTLGVREGGWRLESTKRGIDGVYVLSVSTSYLQAVRTCALEGLNAHPKLFAVLHA